MKEHCKLIYMFWLFVESKIGCENPMAVEVEEIPHQEEIEDEDSELEEVHEAKSSGGYGVSGEGFEEA
ncbi:hypothetical protein L1987_36539 [Smallanthus sonchifolius]|uniref:Uncharacterized protein n=1 Tax=Smallanthus sonchifolius TaxID=185202 RepID=A0ACB9HF83_9ASTR|nr:hypothetical protein L1987_36539 [Smallanthus sonchifolius]